MKLKKLEAGEYRIIDNETHWIGEKLTQIGNPAAIGPTWKTIFHTPTLEAAAKQLCNEIGSAADDLKKDLTILTAA